MPRIGLVVVVLALVGCGSTGGKSDAGAGGGTGVGGGLGTGGGSNTGGGANTGGGGSSVTCTPACSGATPVCNPATRTCVACVTSSDCPASAPACNPTTNTCGSNDTCASPAVITFVNGAAHLQGDTTGATNGNDAGDPAPCGSTAKASGNDLVYAFTLTDTTDVSVTVTPVGDGGMTFRPEAYIRAGACDDSSLAAEVACDYQVSSIPVTISAQTLDAGTYYVWVDGTGTTAGPFTLDVLASAIPPAPANDDCAGAQALTFTNGTATATGNTRSATNSTTTDGGSPSCSSLAASSGRDVVFTYDLPALNDVTITVTPAPGSTLNPVVYVRSQADCATETLAAQLGCNAPFANSTSTLKFRSQAAGSYALWVDGSNSTSGAFTVTVTASTPVPPPANDDCGGVIALAIDPTTGAASVTGDTSNATNSTMTDAGSPTCSPSAQSTGPDVVYSYQLTTPKDVTLTVVADGGLSPALYVRATNACASEKPSSELACAADIGGVASTDLANQQPGTYFVWVDSRLSTSGTFALNLATSTPLPAPTNDTCATATVWSLTAAGTTQTDLVNLGAATSNIDTSTSMCAFGSSPSGPDVAYDIEVAGAGIGKTLVVTATPNASTDPVLIARTGKCDSDAGIELDCADQGASGTAETLTVPNASGHYYVILKAYSSSAGRVTMSATLQ